MTPNALSKAALTRTLPPLRAQMGKSAAALDQLLALLTPDGSINLALALETLYPAVRQTRALANLRQLRVDIEKAAQKSGITINLAGDKKTRTPAAERSLWFEGEDRLSEALEQQVKPNIAGPPRSPQDAIRLGPKRIYVAYSDQDATDAEKLLDLLAPHGKIFEFELWHHKLILPGENPQEERLRQHRQSDLTLHLLSPSFQAEHLDDPHDHATDQSPLPSPTVPLRPSDLLSRARKQAVAHEESVKNYQKSPERLRGGI